MTEPQEPRGTAPAHLTTEELSECAFSPETAAAGLLEHAEGCGRCSAELADLRLVLTELAALPEPALPESVGIRLDAAVVRAWQEADADAEAAAGAAASAVDAARRGPARPFWRKIAIPLGSLSLIVLAIFGTGSLLTNSGSSSSSATAGAATQAATESNGSVTNLALEAWVHSVLPGSATYGTAMPDGAQPAHSPMAQPAHCAVGADTPQRSGYTVLTTSQREYQGRPATLVVYQDAQKPASPTVYAVVYASFCPSSSSAILAQGPVSR